MNNEVNKRKRFLTYFIVLVILVILPIIFPKPWSDSLSNIINGSLAAIIAVEVAFWQLNKEKEENRERELKERKEAKDRENREKAKSIERHQNELNEQARLSAYSLIIVMNNFPNLVEEGKRIDILTNRFSESHDKIELQRMSDEVKVFSQEFHRSSLNFEKNILLIVKDADKLVNIDKKVNSIRFELKKLSEDLKPEYMDAGFKFSQRSKEKIVNEMLDLKNSLVELFPAANSSLYEESCEELMNYRQLIHLVKIQLEPFVSKHLGEKIYSKDILDNIQKKKEIDNVKSLQEVRQYDNPANKKGNVVRCLMKLWALRNDSKSSKYSYQKDGIKIFVKENSLS